MVIVQVNFLPKTTAYILQVPAFFAVTTPLEETAATRELELFHVIF